MVYKLDEAAADFVASEMVIRGHQGIFSESEISFGYSEAGLGLSNKTRVLYNSDQPTAKSICRTKENAATPLDLMHSSLRTMSPNHIKSLENLGVRAYVYLIDRGK